MRRLLLLSTVALIGCGAADAAVERGLPRAREFEIGRARENVAMPYFDVNTCFNGCACYAQPTTCTVTGNLLTSPDDISVNPWVAQAGTAAAPIVTPHYDADPAGGWSAARVQFAAVTSGQESTLWQSLAHACDGIACRYSIFLRATPNGSGPSTGNLPVATGANGGDGFQPTNCAFTTSWSRCDFTVTNSGSFSYMWLGYAAYGAGYSGAGPAMDLELWMPSVKLGSTTATYNCTTTSQLALSTGGDTSARLASDWGIAPRDGATIVTTADNTMVLLGGWNGIPQTEFGSRATTNRILKSTNGGASWTQVLDHDDAPPQTGVGQRWNRRHLASMFTATVGGTEYIYVIGGDHLNLDYGGTSGPYPAEVWRSVASTYGATWTRMCGGSYDASGTDCEWGSRIGLIGWAIGSTLYVAGGQTDILTPSTALNDVWKSTNGGTNWTRVTEHAPWAARGFISNGLPTFNGKVWLTGGMKYADPLESRVHYNDVWSFDGTRWMEMLSCAPWAPRGFVNSAAFDSKLWVIRGSRPSNSDDAWYTADGVAWNRYPGAVSVVDHAGCATVNAAGTVLTITCGASDTTTPVWTLTKP